MSVTASVLFACPGDAEMMPMADKRYSHTSNCRPDWSNLRLPPTASVVHKTSRKGIYLFLYLSDAQKMTQSQLYIYSCTGTIAYPVRNDKCQLHYSSDSNNAVNIYNDTELIFCLGASHHFVPFINIRFVYIDV